MRLEFCGKKILFSWFLVICFCLQKYMSTVLFQCACIDKCFCIAHQSILGVRFAWRAVLQILTSSSKLGLPMLLCKSYVFIQMIKKQNIPMLRSYQVQQKGIFFRRRGVGNSTQSNLKQDIQVNSSPISGNFYQCHSD